MTCVKKINGNKQGLRDKRPVREIDSNPGSDIEDNSVDLAAPIAQKSKGIYSDIISREIAVFELIVWS